MTLPPPPSDGVLSMSKDRIRILLLEGVHDSAVQVLADEGYRTVEHLSEALQPRELQARVADVHILGIRSRTQLTRDVLARAPRLFAIGCFSVGTDQVDLAAAAEAGIPVFNAPHANTRSVAELVLGLTVMLLRDVFRRSGAAHTGEWLKTAKGSHEVRGKTLGIVGYGHIGSQVSVLAEALGMQVLFHDIAPRLPLGNARGAGSLDELLSAADVITLHVPDTPQTRGLLDADRLDATRPGAYLINTSRGSVVDLAALADRLSSGRIGGAAVDVFPTEPAGPGQHLETPLRGLSNVILTPHIGGSTLEAQQSIGAEVATKLAHFSDRGTSIGSVNFPELNLTPHEGSHRLLHIHRNVPGVLRQINRIFADAGANVVGQHLETRGDLGYVVLDVVAEDSRHLLADMKRVEGTIRARILY